jgi:hypothetical protein
MFDLIEPSFQRYPVLIRASHIMLFESNFSALDVFFLYIIVVFELIYILTNVIYSKINDYVNF